MARLRRGSPGRLLLLARRWARATHLVLVVKDIRILIVIMRILVLVFSRLGKFFLRIMPRVNHGLPLRNGVFFVGGETSLLALCQGVPTRVLYNHAPAGGVKQKSPWSVVRGP